MATEHGVLMSSSDYGESARPSTDGRFYADPSAFYNRVIDSSQYHTRVIEDDDQNDEQDMRTSNLAYRPGTGDTTSKGNATSVRENGYSTARSQLPPLQARDNLDGMSKLEPVVDDDPSSYDLVAPGDPNAAPAVEEYSLEKRSQALFSKEHLQVIFASSDSLLKFTSFLGMHYAQAVPILVHYLDTLKALRALHYANAILEGLDPVQDLEFTKQAVPATKNRPLEARAMAAFEYLVKEVLPAYVTHQYIQIVSASISARVAGMLAPHLREASEGLAEVFCLTDPSRADNPIVFASEEFNRTTQYGMSYVLGKNCRFLQGPFTNPNSVTRLRDAIAAGRQHQEVFLNYRRDGSPFLNLLMVAPLCDSRGRVRYFIGAQVDVSGLAKECAEMESFQRLLELQERGEKVQDPQEPSIERNDELAELAEMLNLGELSTIRRYGGRMHREGLDDDNESIASGQPRLLLKDPNTMTPPIRDGSGRLSGVYQHYLLVRPYPSLRILFASPSQRVPGILQSPFMNKIGGSNRVREELTAALAEGRGVTAKVRWINKGDEEGRNKWLHCTPLVGSNGRIGVWMVVIVDDEKGNTRRYVGGARAAPPVTTSERSFTPNAKGNGVANGTGPETRISLEGSTGSFRMD